MKFSFKNFLLLLAIILCVVVMATVFNGYGAKTEKLTHGEVLSYLNDGKVESLTVKNNASVMLAVRVYDENGNQKFADDGIGMNYSRNHFFLQAHPAFFVILHSADKVFKKPCQTVLFHFAGVNFPQDFQTAFQKRGNLFRCGGRGGVVH